MIGSNPALNEETFSIPVSELDDNRKVMTMQGTAFRALTLVGVCVVAASITWGMAFKHGFGAAMPWAIGGGIAAFIIALITCFKPQFSPVTALLYAITKGLFLGAISAFYESSFGSPNGQATIYQGIVFQAVSLTFGVLAVMLALYATRIIRVTDKLRTAVLAAVGAIFLAYIANFVMGFFGTSMPYIHDSGPIGIGISLVIIGVAAFMLLIDFDLIERGVQTGAPKYMEWYGGFALLVTLAWLYLEILRLLAKLRSR